MYPLFRQQQLQIEEDKKIIKLKLDRAVIEHQEQTSKNEILHRHLLIGEKRHVCKETEFEEKTVEDTTKNELENQRQREEKKRQLLWENSPELRELRQQMLVANVTRDQAMQMAEKRAIQELKRKEDELYAEEWNAERVKDEEESKERELQELQAKIKYHKDLDELVEYKRSKDTKDEGVEEERAAVDAIRKQIEEEDRERKRQQVEKQRELNRQAQELQGLRDEMRLQEKLKNAEEDAKVEEYIKAQDLRGKEQEEKKQLNLEQRLQVQDELLSEIVRICNEKLQREHLRIKLAIEEKELEDRAKDEDAENKKRQIQEELQCVYDMQMEVKKQKGDLQKREEELYREHLMSKLYAEDKLELMSQEKRRRKKLEHGRMAQSMIEESRKKKALEQARELADQKYHEDLESKRLQLVNTEKINFLKENAPDLLGYLPKRIFEDEQMIEQLGEDFKKFYYREGCCSKQM